MTLRPTSSTRPDPVPTASRIDTLHATVRVLVPLVARGLIVRRPPVVALAERLDLDRRAVRELQRLHAVYGPGPVLLRLPGRRVALVLDPTDVHRVLARSPELFSAATLEKRHALGQFQPQGVLVSEGAQREDRRRFNEAVLDTDAPIHRDGEAMLRAVREEAACLLHQAAGSGTVTWDAFATAWQRVVRRVTFGDALRDDDEVTDLTGALRARANWSYLRPTDRGLRRRLLARIRELLADPAPGSLAASAARAPVTELTAPEQQVPQWLFAFDPAGIATFRALALLSTHPAHRARVRDELAGRDLRRPQDLPAVRATVLESLRLWPTTPGILRDSRVATRWEQGVLPRGSTLVIHAPFFHRDDRMLEDADRFAPDLWARPRTPEDWPFVPFSEGPIVCPGRNLVLLLASAMVASLLETHEFRLRDPGRLAGGGPLPSVLDPFTLAFEVRPRTADVTIDLTEVPAP